MNKYKKVITAFAISAAFLTTLAVQHTYAADSTIHAGTLTMTQPTTSNFADVTLNGHVQTTHASIGDFTVSDATGSKSGWNVVVKASPFTKAGTDPHTLPANSIEIARPTVTSEHGSSEVSTIITEGGTIDNVTGVKLLSAQKDGGMGTFTISIPTNALILTLQPKDIVPGTYTSTISYNIVSGP